MTSARADDCEPTRPAARGARVRVCAGAHRGATGKVTAPPEDEEAVVRLDGAQDTSVMEIIEMRHLCCVLEEK
jgi:hypothetical protein